ncbi:peptidoglycan DD-metalloendopeptidase family protein [Sedimentibacter sp.]|uniref:LysM peptidoglycan-binding domain-containing M23 family metallopeptidase n=1 Tax=Sedimentibacter sp. TaxID=1960295 RepID=UPI00289814BB|nr:peptidoglycan DD-metalloendopeptidase family protein [Sedimentibacter sp.]
MKKRKASPKKKPIIKKENVEIFKQFPEKKYRQVFDKIKKIPFSQYTSVIQAKAEQFFDKIKKIQLSKFNFINKEKKTQIFKEIRKIRLPKFDFSKYPKIEHTLNRIKEIEFSNPLSRQLKGAACLLTATLLILSGTYTMNYLNTHENNVFSTESFTISKNDTELCKVRDKELLYTTLAKLEKDLEETYNHELAIESKFEISESTAKDNEIITVEGLYNILKDNINYSILAYSINVDGQQIGVVNSEDEASDIIDEVKDHFAQYYDEETIIEVSTVENVEIKQIKAANNEIKDKENLVNYIIKGTEEEKKYIVEKGDNYWNIAEYFNMSLDDLIQANPTSDPERIQIGDELNLVVPKPFINVQIKRLLVQEEKTPYETDYNKVSYMFSDEEVIEKKGKYGLSKIESIVTEQNGIQIAKEILSEEVIEEPVTQIVTTGTQDPPPKKGTGYFINPLPGSVISSRFGSRSGGFHLGQDMAKASGSSIKAADGGTVTYAGWSGSYGYMVDIDHGGGYTTRYAHCSEIYVSVGEKVYQGKVIAAVGSTGVSSGPHLHFEVRKYGSVVNPAAYIGVQYR